MNYDEETKLFSRCKCDAADVSLLQALFDTDGSAIKYWCIESHNGLFISAYSMVSIN